MATIEEVQSKLDYLDETKQLIKEAIIEKGQDITSEETFREFVEKIASIYTGGNIVSPGIGITGLNFDNITVGETLNWGAEKGVYRIGDMTTVKVGNHIDGNISKPVFIEGFLVVKIINMVDIETTTSQTITGEIVEKILPKLPIVRGNLIYFDNKNWYNYEYSGLNVSTTDVLSGKTFLSDSGVISGSMPNNGQLNYSPLQTAQTIPAGYTSGGTISGMDITITSDYGNCLSLSKQILGI